MRHILRKIIRLRQILVAVPLIKDIPFLDGSGGRFGYFPVIAGRIEGNELACNGRVAVGFKADPVPFLQNWIQIYRRISDFILPGHIIRPVLFRRPAVLALGQRLNLNHRHILLDRHRCIRCHRLTHDEIAVLVVIVEINGILILRIELDLGAVDRHITNSSEAVKTVPGFIYPADERLCTVGLRYFRLKQSIAFLHGL